MGPSGATCLPADCFRISVNYYYKNPFQRVGLVQSGHHDHFTECNLFSPWYSWKIAELALSNNHSLFFLLQYIENCVDFLKLYHILNWLENVWSRQWLTWQGIFQLKTMNPSFAIKTVWMDDLIDDVRGCLCLKDLFIIQIIIL
jgi:hypothetical protein